MNTFLAVNDEEVVKRLAVASRRIVYVAPGVSTMVANAIGRRLTEVDSIDITVVLDPDDDVCRIGYGDAQGLATLHQLAVKQHVALRKQRGLRIGVLIVDEELFVWSPTPRSIEEARVDASMPNGIALGRHPTASLIAAIAPEGSDIPPIEAEIGIQAVTPDDVRSTLQAIEANPVVPVELAQVTRVFSTALQFVELKITHSRLSSMSVSISNELLNADASAQLRGLLDSKIQAFGEARNVVVAVPTFIGDGEPAFDADGRRLEEEVTEADLNRRRTALEKKFLYRVGKYGALLEKSRRLQFEATVRGLEAQLLAYSRGVMANLDATLESVKADAMALVEGRLAQSQQSLKPFSKAEIEERLEGQLRRRRGMEPTVTYLYKDVTYEHTQSEEFRELVRRALPADVQRKLGRWYEQYRAAKEASAKRR